MHLAKANAPASLLCAVSLMLVGPGEPQAAIASPQPTAANAARSLRRWSLPALVSLALGTVV
jgi:hypothetical protein